MTAPENLRTPIPPIHNDTVAHVRPMLLFEIREGIFFYDAQFLRMRPGVEFPSVVCRTIKGQPYKKAIFV